MNSDSEQDLDLENDEDDDDDDMIQRQQIYSEESSLKSYSKQDSVSRPSKNEESSSGFHTQNSVQKKEAIDSISSGTDFAIDDF